MNREDSSRRAELLVSLATRIADYREGEIDRPTPEHVDRWLNQFDADDQPAILQELDILFLLLYWTKEDIRSFISNLTVNENLVGKDPAAFWRSIGFLPHIPHTPS